MEEYKLKQKAIDAQPIKKVAEAKARKKQKVKRICQNVIENIISVLKVNKKKNKVINFYSFFFGWDYPFLMIVTLLAARKINKRNKFPQSLFKFFKMFLFIQFSLHVYIYIYLCSCSVWFICKISFRLYFRF